MKFALLAGIVSALPEMQPLQEGPIQAKPGPNLREGKVRLNVNAGLLEQQMETLGQNQRALNLPPVGEELSKAAQDAVYSSAAASGRIMGPSVRQINRLVRYLDPSKKCRSA